MNVFLVALGMIVLVRDASASTPCFLCPCNKKLFADVGACNGDCRVSLGCFSNICGTISLPGTPPTAEQDAEQRAAFPKLTCFSVLAQEDKSYNCIGWSAGDKSWVWKEVDSVYGDNDKKVEVEDFDKYYAAGGYVPSASCAQEDGKTKVVLYGKPLPGSGEYQPTHAAKQAADFSSKDGDWWESKEGKEKMSLHKLEELEGANYGVVIKCYERPL